MLTHTDEMKDPEDILCPTCQCKAEDSEAVECHQCSSWLHPGCEALTQHEQCRLRDNPTELYICRACRALNLEENTIPKALHIEDTPKRHDRSSQSLIHTLEPPIEVSPVKVSSPNADPSNKVIEVPCTNIPSHTQQPTSDSIPKNTTIIKQKGKETC